MTSIKTISIPKDWKYKKWFEQAPSEKIRDIIEEYLDEARDQIQ